MRFALLPLAITLASASPVFKRQSVVSSVVEQITTVVPTVVPTVISSAVEGATSAVSSVVEEASSAAVSATSMASSVIASASASASSVPGYALAYPCPAGSDLTYVEERFTFPGTVEQVAPLVAFSNSTWYGVQPNSTQDDGSDDQNQVGAMRTVMFPGVPATIMEVLSQQEVNDTTGAIQQVFNGTAPVTVGNLTISAYSTVFQLYANDTVPTDVTAKLFSNICASPKEEANAALSSVFIAALAALGAQAVDMASPSMSMSSMMMPSMSSMPMPSMSSMMMPSMPASSVVVPLVTSAVVPITSSVLVAATSAAAAVTSA